MPLEDYADCFDGDTETAPANDNEAPDFEDVSDDASPEVLPEIKAGIYLKSVANKAVKALSRDSQIYDRGGALVLVTETEQKPPQCHVVNVHTLRERLSALANWKRLSKEEWVPCAPPRDIAEIVLSRGSWPVRRLAGITQTPSLRPDGTVFESPGYDTATGYLYVPNGSFPGVPDRPTKQQIADAVTALCEVVCDFPWAEEYGKSVWVALVLTLLARPAIDGCTPLFLVDANVAGSGKSRAVDAASIIATGREAPRAIQPEDEAEWRKRITSIVVEGAPMVLIDNVNRPIGGESIDALMTARTWKDRLLGQNKTIEAPCNTVWSATGNNLEVSGDTTRRVLRARLDCASEKPEDRDDFKHPKLLPWVVSQRARLAVAGLTILRAHAVAGWPMGSVRLWGSFERWSEVVAAAVVFAGMPDPQLGRLTDADDPKKAALATVLERWQRLAPDGLTAKAAADALYPQRAPHEHPPRDEFNDLREALELLCECRNGKPPTALVLGKALARYKRKVVAGLRFDSHANRKGIIEWIVQKIDK